MLQGSRRTGKSANTFMNDGGSMVAPSLQLPQMLPELSAMAGEHAGRERVWGESMGSNIHTANIQNCESRICEWQGFPVFLYLISQI